GTWVVLLLPFIEQQNIFLRYQNWGGTTTADSGFPDKSTIGPPYPLYYQGSNISNVTSQRLKVLTCPSDTPRSPNVQGGVAMTAHNYAVNYGNTYYAQGALGTVKFLGAPFIAPTNNRTPRTTSYGFLSITDGTSNTLLLGEVRQAAGQD